LRYRIAEGRTEVYAHRTLSVVALVATAFFAVGALVLVVADPSLWAAWLGLAIFGAGGIVLVRRTTRRGILRGRPALVLDEAGLTDHRTGATVRWADVRAVRAYETMSEGHVDRALRLEPVDPTRGHTDVDLALLAVSQAELAQLIRGRWSGPVTGVDPVDLEAGRRRRAVRLVRWTAGWAIPIGVAIAAVAAYRWLQRR
jgi:hypothetical protein